MSHLDDFFRIRRIERKLTLVQVARLIGYTNFTKGANKINAFEGGGKVHPDLFARLADLLEITPDEIQQRMRDYYQNWLAWANEPVRPHVVVRLLACVYQ